MHGGMDVLRSISIELNVSRPSAEEKSASEIVLPNDFKIGTVKYLFYEEEELDNTETFLLIFHHHIELFGKPGEPTIALGSKFTDNELNQVFFGNICFIIV